MPSLNLDPNYFNHRKTKRLIRLLGKGSEVLPIKLWAYTALYFMEDGRLTGMSAQEIEEECHWWGKPGKMVEIMLLPEVCFLERDGDTFVVHEWQEHEGHLSAYSERAKKGAKARWDKARGVDASSDASSIASSDPTSNAPAELPIPTSSLPPLTPPAEGSSSGGGLEAEWEKLHVHARPLAEIRAQPWYDRLCPIHLRLLLARAVKEKAKKPVGMLVDQLRGRDYEPEAVIAPDELRSLACAGVVRRICGNEVGGRLRSSGNGVWAEAADGKVLWQVAAAELLPERIEVA